MALLSQHLKKYMSLLQPVHSWTRVGSTVLRPHIVEITWPAKRAVTRRIGSGTGTGAGTVSYDPWLIARVDVDEHEFNVQDSTTGTSFDVHSQT